MVALSDHFGTASLNHFHTSKFGIKSLCFTPKNESMTMKSIIIGASSGIGKALAVKLSSEGSTLGLTARRVELLEDLKHQLETETFIERMDVSEFNTATDGLENLFKKMGQIDLIIISAGTGHANDALDFQLEQETINVNATGFVNLACLAYRHFQKNRKGHLVGISSIAMLRGNPGAPAYNASKALISNYMEGLRLKALKEKANIYVTDIRPGYVDTPMAESDHLFWVSSPDKAAAQIYRSIQSKKKIAYITRRWRLIALLMKIMPDFLYKNF